MNRKQFLQGFGAAALAPALGGGCFSAKTPVSKNEPDFIWSSLIHLGRNMWAKKACADHVRFDEGLWRELSCKYKECGLNQIMIDLGEAVLYPSHPELAVKGTWSVEKMREEIARLRGMGFEVIPKVNFSSCHNNWLKDYHFMVSSPTYYRVCEDIINDVAEMFDRPRFIHLGYDEESHEVPYAHNYEYVVIRRGELWWHDFLWFCKVTENAGSRPWIWSDYSRRHPEEFQARMPKSVMQSSWAYSEFKHEGMTVDSAKAGVKVYHQLSDWGYDQVLCGSNCYGWDQCMETTVRFAKAKLRRESVKGFMIAPWGEMARGEIICGYGLRKGQKLDRAKFLFDGADQMAAAKKIWCS